MAGFNLFFFKVSADFSDKSLVATWLSRHSQLNPKMYAKQAAVKTVVQHNSFIAQAYANTNVPGDPEATDNQNLVITEDGMVKPSPDSLTDLITKQVKVYQTQIGDTLASIAKANGISPETIMWANKLTNSTIKPGWFLLIPPVNGVLHKANSNDTLGDLAKKYSVNVETIISYNGLVDENDIDTGQLIIVPGGRMPAPPTPKPKAVPSKVADNIRSLGTHIFPWGQCTWYVATRVRISWGGNAKNWLANAKAYGAVISNRPAPGALVVTTENRRYGHVAYIEQVEGDKFLISEMNYKGKGVKTTRWLEVGDSVIRGFIYP